MALRENKEGTGQFLRGMRDGANLEQVGTMSYKVKDSHGTEDIDFVRAQIHKADFFILRSTE